MPMTGSNAPSTTSHLHHPSDHLIFRTQCLASLCLRCEIRDWFYAIQVRTFQEDGAAGDIPGARPTRIFSLENVPHNALPVRTLNSNTTTTSTVGKEERIGTYRQH